MNITRRRLALGGIAAAALPLLTACKTVGELQPAEIPPADRVETRQPFGAVDVLVIARPEMQSKLDWFGKPVGTIVGRAEMNNRLERTMQELRSELQDVMYAGGLPGVVTLDPRRASPGRTHVLLIVPTEASLTRTGSTTDFGTAVEMRLLQLADRRTVWRGQSTLNGGPRDRQLAQALLAQLKALEVPLNPRPPRLATVEGLAVKLGDPLASVQAALGPAAELKVEGGITTLHAAGIMAQFNAQGDLSMLRLRPPATPSIRGVRLGQRWSEVLEILGEPDSQIGGSALSPSIAPLNAEYRGQGHRLTVLMELGGGVREIRLNAQR